MSHLIIRRRNLVGACLGISLVSFVLGFWQGYKIGEAVTINEQVATKTKHVQVCKSNPKYRGHAAYDIDGSRMCFQQSKLSGRIERVSLVVKGL